MKRTALTSNVFAIVCGALIALAPSSADAGWGSWGGSSGGGSNGSYGASYAYGSSGGSYGSTGAAYRASYGSYGSTGGSTGGSSGGSTGAGYAPVRRVLSHLHQKVHNHLARRPAYGSNGSSGGSSGGYSVGYGSYGSSYSGGSSGGSYYRGYGAYSGGSSGGSVSYGSVGSSYGSAGSVYYGASNQSTSSAGSLVSNSSLEDDSVMLTVAVPTAAKVFVNNNPTSSVGAVRQFVSRGLVNGQVYKFDVRAELASADGQIASETKSVTVTAGQRQAIEFAMTQQSTPVETAVTLHVPEGAKVILAGNETNVAGSTRTYRTSQLVLGHVWEDYTIEVQVGEETKQQKVRLLAGDQIELTFDFDGTTDRIASR